jgi:hypothetical protein
MFRESIGDYKINRYMNREEFRFLMRSLKKKDKNRYDQRVENWAQRVDKRNSNV